MNAAVAVEFLQLLEKGAIDYPIGAIPELEGGVELSSLTLGPGREHLSNTTP